MHYWFKSYGNFFEWMDFAYWWSFIGGGSAINSATPSSFLEDPLKKVLAQILKFSNICRRTEQPTGALAALVAPLRTLENLLSEYLFI